MEHTIVLTDERERADNRFLTFDLGSGKFGIIINQVTEIISLQEINKLPEMPDHILGIINLRGKIVPVMDMSMKLNKTKTEHSGRACIIVIETDQLSVGLVVDNVDEVMQIKDIAPPPELAAGAGCRYINGVGKVNDDIVILIDCDQLFNDEDTHAIEATKGKM